MSSSSLIAFSNPAVFQLGDIPVSDYRIFREQVLAEMEKASTHCLSYFCWNDGSLNRFYCLLGDDSDGSIQVFSHEAGPGEQVWYPSLSARNPAFLGFERELAETSGMRFNDHPWLRPLRFSLSSRQKGVEMDAYPFYKIAGDEIHEVGVGPVHAGVIEPGHFRFNCIGEKVLHLEIQLGYQHRGIEELFKRTGTLLGMQMLAESVAGDTAVGHGLAHARLIEALAGWQPDIHLQATRMIALELERMAVHVGDCAALFNDVAFQLGQVVNEALRTTLINTTQLWCGNRFGKGLIRAGGNRYPLTGDLCKTIIGNTAKVSDLFLQMAERAQGMSSVLLRFDQVGVLATESARLLACVGMAARASGIPRDIRYSHPFGPLPETGAEPDLEQTGDVLARYLIRVREFSSSLRLIGHAVNILEANPQSPGVFEPIRIGALKPNALAVSLCEAWRGEVAHVAITGPKGEIVKYKLKDPSFHNWNGLALALRDQEISDFPVCNKSFNLSYCGHDL